LTILLLACTLAIFGLSVPVCVQVARGVSHASMRGAAAMPGACLLTSRHERLELPWHADSAAPHPGTACGTAALPLVAPNAERPACSPSRCILTPSTLSAGAPPSDLHGPPGAGASGGQGRIRPGGPGRTGGTAAPVTVRRRVTGRTLIGQTGYWSNAHRSNH
jgi:hypothetical protein